MWHAIKITQSIRHCTLDIDRNMAALLLVLFLWSGCGGRSSLFSWQHDGGGHPSQKRPDAAARDILHIDAPITPDSMRPDPLSFSEEVARACAYAISCSSMNDYLKLPTLHSVSQCIRDFSVREWPLNHGYLYAFGGETLTLTDRLLHCARETRTSPYFECETFTSCYGGNWVSFGQCIEGATCVDNKLVPGSSYYLLFDCSSLGASCINLPTGAQRACCMKQPCAARAPNDISCQGSQGTQCIWGTVLSEFDCAALDGVCYEGDPSTSVHMSPCRGTGAPCNIDQPPTCQGAQATFCLKGQLATVDCAKNPLRSACDPASSPFSSISPAPCTYAGQECGPDHETVCDHDALLVCLDGRIVSLDCLELGFEMCYQPKGQPAQCGFGL